MLLIALSEALERQLTAGEADVGALRDKLLEHTGVEAASNKDFISRFLEDNTTFETAAGLIQRIANSSDSSRLQVLLQLRNEATLSYAEQRALDLAIDNVKRGVATVDLQARAVGPERQKISQMVIPGSAQMTQILQVNKYARFIARKNSPVYKMAEAKILELIGHGILNNDDEEA